MWSILIQVLPCILAVVLMFALGYRMGELLPRPTAVFSQLLYLGSSLALIIMINEHGWNILLGIGHGFISGLVMFWTGIQVINWQIMFLMIWFLFSYFLSSRVLFDPGKFISGILILDLTLYSCGWIMIDFGFAGDWVTIIWKMLGIILFGIALVIELIRAKQIRDPELVISFGIRLYLISLTMYWVIGIGGK